MDMLVMRDRPRRGIRNSGYDVSHMSLPTDPVPQQDAVKLPKHLIFTILKYKYNIMTFAIYV